MNRRLRAAVAALQVLAFFCLFLVSIGLLVLITAGIWLAPSADPPERADALVVLSGGLERSLYAADLFQAGLAPKILVSRPAKEQVVKILEDLHIEYTREEDLHRQILVRKGVPPDALEFFGEGSLSTAEEARVLAGLIAGPARLLVVTSPTHVLRARISIESAFRGKGVSVQVVPTPYESFDVRWWQNQGSARSVILEMAKLAYYFLGGRFFSDGS